MDPIPNKTLEISGEDEASTSSSGSMESHPIPQSLSEGDAFQLHHNSTHSMISKDWTRKVDKQRPESSAPSCVSMKSDWSIDLPYNFKDGHHSTDQRVDKQRPESSAPSCVSMKSDWSIDLPYNFKDGHHSTDQRVDKQRPESSAPSCVSMKSDWSIDLPYNFKDGHHSTDQRLRTRCPVCKGVLKDPVKITCGHRFCRKCNTSSWDQPGPSGENACPVCGKKARKDPELSGKIVENTGYSNIQKVKITFKKEMRERFTSTPEGSGNGEQKSLMSSIYTTLYITPEEREDPSVEHELRQIERRMRGLLLTEISVNDIFKSLQGQEDQHQRLVLTKGIAGIGKSFTVQKFALDWAEEKANNDIDFVFVLAFREINLCKKPTSLHELLMKFHPALQGLSDSLEYTTSTVAIVLDGLDESRLSLYLPNNEVPDVTSVTQEASVDVLLTSLIKGKLLPSAHLWITSRVAAANQIPAQYVNMVTEIKGFNDQQKEEYFRKKFVGHPGLADHVIPQIQSSHILLMMCHIPVFCWILAQLFQDSFVGRGKMKVIFATLTEMMSHYLLVQTKRRSRKYDQKTERNIERLLKSHRDLLLGLGRLAFKHLEKNSLIFYEEDLQECKIDVTEASIYSGFCAMILKEEQVFDQKKVFSFVHLTVQEFFAALYVYDCFINKNIEALHSFLGQEQKTDPITLLDMLKMTINKVLESKNGQLDLFLRFLLGLTCESNREVLSGLLSPEEETSSENTSKKIFTYLKTRMKRLSPESCITLFQCMVEMRNNKVKEEIEEYLLEDHSGTELSPFHCSALAYTLLVSKEELKEFVLSSYNTSEHGRIRLIPAVTCSRKASLAECNLSEEFVKQLVPSLMLPYSALRELDLSNSDLLDVGVELLTTGLKSPSCKLTKLSLSGCQVTNKGCTHLASALRDNPSCLRELDLSYNHLGDGATMLSDLKNNPDLKLNVEHGGPRRIKPGFKKYACDLTLDPSTAHKNLLLSEDNRKVTWGKEEQPYPERIQSVCQVLSREELRDRCYWEAEVSKPFNIGVTYAAIRGEGNKNASRLGSNKNSWSVMGSDEGCFASHDDKKVDISCKCTRSGGRLGVYLDWSAGTLAFYKVSSDKATLLHRFKNEEFTESLHVGVEVHPQSSVTLCKSI